MKVSVVICTRDRHETIGQAVESVAQCGFSSFDIHIMDQSTNDLTHTIINDLAKKHAENCPINYHHLEKAGLSRAYNQGMQASEAHLVAFTDDDVVVDADWLANVVKAFDADPEVGLLYGQVMVPSELVNAKSEGLIVPHLCFKDRERLGRESRFRVYGMGANMAIRRTSFDKVGGFDEALGGGGPLRSSQDFDYAYRTYLVGDVVLLDPDVKVDHYGTRTVAQWPDTMKNYGIGDGAFYGKHVRCGDLFARRVLFGKLARAKLRRLRAAITLKRSFSDPYGDHLMVGYRMGQRFEIDKKLRLYRETDDAKFDVTLSNQVTAANKPSA